MSNLHRINLLSPYLDGEYYGTIFTTLHREVTNRNAMLLTIQALASNENPAAFDYRVGTEVTDGWILVTNPHSALPASRNFLEAIKATGKPVVTIGYEETRIPSSAVCIDNRQAVREAVEHLHKVHGHRRIAFVGATEHLDLVERYHGYREALTNFGLPADDGLFFAAPNSLRHGGAAAAKAMLEKGIDFTAIVAATDLNALGLIETLQEAGYDVPGDLAVIGFDDLPSAAESDPPLTSVHQPIADLAREAINLLFRQLDGEQQEPKVIRVNTRFVPRASCGCAYASDEKTREVLQAKLTQSENNVKHLVESHNQLAANLVSASRDSVFDFSKMFRGISHWGCLAMWETDGDNQRMLTVRNTFAKPGDPVPATGTRIPIERFPATEWLPEIGQDEFVRIQFIRSDAEDLGFIVLVGPIDRLVLVSEVDITRISCNVSVTALMRDKAFNQVRAIADQLEIVSRTTNDGIWDWDLVDRKFHWSPRIHDMMGIIGEKPGEDEESFFRLIHPDDYARVSAALKEHFNRGEPFREEFRIVSEKTGRQLWLYAAGDTIRNDKGEVVRMIGSLNNITEKKRSEEQIRRLAFHDVLTGLPNRQLLRQRFQSCLVKADKTGDKIGIMLIDLDRFKIINDSLGHQIGDLLLLEVGRTLEQIVNPPETGYREDLDRGLVARLGGDEFIVLVPGIREDESLQQLADEMITRFQKPFKIGQVELYTSASIGLATYPDDGRDLDALTRCADIAMYKAKEHGKNRSEWYSRDNHAHTVERLNMENELRRALERGEFELHYQPQIDLDSGCIRGTEALIRWLSAERGLVSPGEFIPLAEDGGMIIPLGRWVLREACRQQKEWLDRGFPASTVSVNISASQLHQNDFVDMVKGILAETGLPSASLCLEITEGTAIMNWHNSVEKLEKLRELGVQLALDDFGTGYSSLSMLKQLPINIVKIDRSFVRHMAEDGSDAAIASTIIALARTLGLTVIAEGVETEAQRARLLAEKCHAIQGYIYSKPLPAAEYDQFVQNWRGKPEGSG